MKSALELSFFTASAKVSVMFRPALVTVAPSSRLERRRRPGPVASTVNVAFAAVPWLPAAS